MDICLFSMNLRVIKERISRQCAKKVLKNSGFESGMVTDPDL